MFNKKIVMLCIATVLSSSLWAKDHSSVDEMINLPHPVKVIMPNIKKLEISKTQEEELNDKMLGYYPEIIQGLMQKAAKLEKEIKNDVLVGKKTKEELSSKIDKLEKIKREVTDVHIDALNTLTNILNDKQFTQSLKMMKAPQKSNKFKIDELVILPHPGPFIKKGQIKINKEQKVRFVKEVKAVYPPVFQGKMREAFKLEKKVQRLVAKGKTKEDVKDLLDQIAKLKREAMDGRIDALNHIQKILGEEDWKKVNKLTYK